VPGSFNFTRDVVEALAHDTQRQALTYVGNDGIIEPRSFLQLAHGAARWAAVLRENGVRPGDRILVVARSSPDWVEALLAGIKVGAVTVPCAETLPAPALDVRVAAAGAKLVVASRAAEGELAQTTTEPHVLYLDEARQEALRHPKEAPTHDTSVRDPAFIVSTTGRTNGPRGVLHTHASTFAARLHAEHWLDAGPGDVVWCTAGSDSPHALWSTLLGPWARGAQVVLHEGPLDPVERLDLVHRLGVTVLCQRPAEYQALAETGHLARFRSARPRRLVATGDHLADDLVLHFEEQWGLTVHDGYGQAETGVIVGHTPGAVHLPGSIGRPLPGYVLAVLDEHGNELPPEYEGRLALRGRPPSLFAGYWNASGDTKVVFHGDWYLTGDVGLCDRDGFFWLLDRRRPAMPSLGLSPASIAAPEAAVAVAVAVPKTPVPEVVEVASAPVAVPERTAAPPLPPVTAQVSASEARESSPDGSPSAARPRETDIVKRAAPLWARATAVIWLLLLGMLVGGAAIPHADDEPRVVPPADDPPNAICLPKKPGR
jgi:acyl-coenzyme A synthetase/AMP-(fatty) acid ligase